MAIRLYKLGFKDLKGREVLACIHQYEWWPHYRAAVKKVLGIDVNTLVVQFTGNAVLSAGTHDGPNWDQRTFSITAAQRNEIIRIAREGGARGSWFREWKNNNHTHHVLDCPCISKADYQLAEVDRGDDGLIGNGKDTSPKPKVKRDYKKGIVYLRSLYEPPKPSGGNPKPKPTVQVIVIANVLKAISARAKSDDIVAIQSALNANYTKHGQGRAPADGSWSSVWTRVYAGWQRYCGYRGKDASGMPGRASATRLLGYSVKVK